MDIKSKITVKLSTSYPELPHIRQTPGGLGRWENVQFYVDQDILMADFWVVNDNIVHEHATTVCRADGKIYFGGEPPMVRDYVPKFLKQFDTVITCQDINHPGLIKTQQSLAWNIGFYHNRKISTPVADNRPRFGYNDFKSMPVPEKSRLIAVISSNKTMTSGHVQRLRFVEALKRHFGDRLDVFGTGINPVADKWDVIAPYRYHIALENCSYPHYWTEKLSDAYLGWSHPFYFGCPNLHEYFPGDSYTPIDINDPEKSIARIEDGLASNLFEKNLEALAEARRRVLDVYNLFAVVAKLCQERMDKPTVYRKVTLRPEAHFRRQKTLADHLRRVARYLGRRLNLTTQER